MSSIYNDKVRFINNYITTMNHMANGYEGKNADGDSLKPAETKVAKAMFGSIAMLANTLGSNYDHEFNDATNHATEKAKEIVEESESWKHKEWGLISAEAVVELVAAVGASLTGGIFAFALAAGVNFITEKVDAAAGWEEIMKSKAFKHALNYTQLATNHSDTPRTHSAVMAVVGISGACHLLGYDYIIAFTTAMDLVHQVKQTGNVTADDVYKLAVTIGMYGDKPMQDKMEIYADIITARDSGSIDVCVKNLKQFSEKYGRGFVEVFTSVAMGAGAQLFMNKGLKFNPVTPEQRQELNESINREGLNENLNEDMVETEPELGAEAAGRLEVTSKSMIAVATIIILLSGYKKISEINEQVEKLEANVHAMRDSLIMLEEQLVMISQSVKKIENK